MDSNVDVLNVINELKVAWETAYKSVNELPFEDLPKDVKYMVDQIKWFTAVGAGQLDYSRMTPDVSISIQEFYGYGAILCSECFSRYINTLYNYLDIRWFLNTRAIKSKWLVCRKSVIEAINSSGTCYSEKDYKRDCSRDIYSPYFSYRRIDWSPDAFSGHNLEPKSEKDFQDFLDGKLVPTTTGFWDTKKDDIICTLLIPIDILHTEIDMFEFYWWGLFPQIDFKGTNYDLLDTRNQELVGAILK